MYNGKIKVWVSYHFGNDEYGETILTETVGSESEVWGLLDKVFPESFWHGDDGEYFDEWADDAKPTENAYEGTFYQACALLSESNARYFLAVCTPAE